MLRAHESIASLAILMSRWSKTSNVMSWEVEWAMFLDLQLHKVQSEPGEYFLDLVKSPRSKGDL